MQNQFNNSNSEAKLKIALSLLDKALDYFYNPFEPDNQSDFYRWLKMRIDELKSS